MLRRSMSVTCGTSLDGKEPKFYSPYRSSRDIRSTFAYIRHKYRVWKAFRDHTAYWPVFSILFHFLSWAAVFGFIVASFAWATERKREVGWSIVAAIGCDLALLGVRELGARLIRKVDWKRYGS